MDLSLLSNFLSNVHNDFNGQPQLSPEEEQQRQAKMAALKQLMAMQGAPPMAPQINPQAAQSISNVFK